ncbi:MAG: hypothetical protein CMB91_02030 [Flammeovirgaceae bacterium]|nr:hypothetical protein [Flammeovirgaceae bacterium]
MKYLNLLILFFFFSSNLFSQTNYSEFIKLKRLFIEEKYSIISAYDHQIDKKNEFYPYAVFYKGVSEYKLSSYDKSGNYLEEIIALYPNWSQLDEVYYWQIKVDLKTNNFDNALLNFSVLNNSEIKEILYPDIDPFLENISSSKLYDYYELYPQNKSVAKYYGRFLLKEYLDSNVIEEINKILKIVEAEDLFISKKSNFKIAVLLPFMFEGIENNTFIKKNDFIMDLYTGINYGFNNNDSVSTNIQILSFDTKRNPDTIKKLIEEGSLDNGDLIIGPLYSKPIEIVKQFCLEKKILMINPLSSNNKIIDDNNYSFLFKPSINTIAKQTADYSINNFSKNKNVLIFYENNYQDSLIASLYKQKLDSSNFNIIYSKSVSFEDSRLILDSLASTYEYILSDSLFDTLSNVPKIVIKEGRGIDKLDTTYMYTEKFFIEDDSIGHIFVSSKNSLFASNAISALDIRNDTIPIIGYTEWLDYNVISVDQFQNLDVRMIGTTFFEKENESFKKLNNFFMSDYNRKISNNFLVGYDLINMIIKINNNYGNYFQFGLRNEKLIETNLLSNPYYLEFNDNQNVKIYKVDDFKILPKY